MLYWNCVWPDNNRYCSSNRVNMQEVEHFVHVSSCYRYMKGLIKNNITLAKRFNFTTRYIDDVLTLNNSRFVTEIRHIYPS